MTTEASKEQPKEEKKEAPKKAPAAKASMRTGVQALALATAHIAKSTGQKPIAQAKSTLPHVPSGSLFVDHLIGGSPAADGKGPICPGFPRRRITEIYGPESSGKTTLLLSAMVQAQKAGGSCMFIDFEHSLDHNYARNLGLKIPSDTFAVFAPDTMEEGLDMMAKGILYGVDIVGVDSVAAMVPKDELEKGFDEATKLGIVARILSDNLKKFAVWLQKYPMEGPKEDRRTVKGHPGTALVFLNQTRALIQTGGGGYGGDNENTAGGKALKFYSYLRLRLARIKSEFIERMSKTTGKKERVAYGNLTDVKVVKSKIDAKQGQHAQIFIRYGFGVDDYFSIVETGVVHKYVKKEGSRYVFGGETFHGKDKFRQFLINNPKAFAELRAKLADAIMSSAVVVHDDEMTDDDQIMEMIDEDTDDVGMEGTEAPTEETVEESAES